MEAFDRLGASVDRAWNRKPATFAGVAHAALAEARLDVPWVDVVRWFQRGDGRPAQQPLDPAWGHPAITAFRARDFFIEVIFWLDGSTTVHQHAFSGAFQVLEGQSLHTRYRFENAREVAPRLRAGDLITEGAERLHKGDLRTIEAGPRLIHSLFHLDHPSVTVVVRTFQEPHALPQLAYRPPHLAWEPFADDSELRRMVQSLELLHAARPLDHAAALSELLSRLDFAGCWRVLEHAFRVTRDPARLERLYARARARHGELVELLPPVFAAQARSERLLAERRTVTDPERRLQMAIEALSAAERDP